MLVKFRLVLAILGIIFGHISLSTAETSLLGVSPEDLSKYQKNKKDGKFTCFDKSKVISFEEINDNYCDCLDGSDEPGTSACKSGLFYCQNKGHFPASISSLFVNDGICDSECCDGSDENNGIVKCPNTCVEKANQYKKDLAERLLIAKKGAEKKAMLEKQGKDILAERTNLLNEVESELGYLKNVISLKKYQLENAEREERESQELEKVQEKFSPSALAEQILRLQEKIRELESSVQIFRTSTQEKKDISDFLVQVENIFAGHSEDLTPLPNIKPEEETATPSSFFGRVIASWKILWNVSPPKPKEISSKRAQKAREEHEEVLSKEQKLIAKKEDLDKILNLDFKKKLAFVTFYDQCYSLVVNQYTYTLCPFRKVTQTDANGYNVDIGSWNGKWLDDATWLLDGGNSCWNGPDRSTKVFLKCGIEPRVTDAIENSRCLYEMTFENPASCSDVVPEPEVLTTNKGEDL